MMKKRLCAAILAVAVVCSLWVQPGSAAETDAANVNQNLLNAILYGERKWVAETLLDDDRSNNPMAKLHKIHGKKSLDISSLIAVFSVRLGIGSDEDVIIIAFIMLLVPGVAFGTAMRDLFCGDLAAGSLKILQAFLLALMIAFGYTMAMLVL